MIVNPQLFNYRLITGSLVLTIAVISIFSFTNYQENKADQQFLQQEKKLVEIEISQMVKQYNQLSNNNDLLTSQLEVSNNTIEAMSDSLRSLRNELTFVTKFRQQVSILEVKNAILINEMNSLQLKNDELEKEIGLVKADLENETEINNSISEENKLLAETLKKAALITANSFNAKALNKVLGKTVVTSKASKANSIEVSFTLAENAFAQKGEKDIYIQILTPENNVFADKGAINFEESSLIYSTKKVVPYSNEALNVTLVVDAKDDDQPLTKGNYYISVFHKDIKLGGTLLQLD